MVREPVGQVFLELIEVLARESHPAYRMLNDEEVRELRVQTLKLRSPDPVRSDRLKADSAKADQAKVLGLAPLQVFGKHASTAIRMK